jgi:hypothetical protein
MAAAEAEGESVAEDVLTASYRAADDVVTALPSRLRRPDRHLPLRLRLAGAFVTAIALVCPDAAGAALELATHVLESSLDDAAAVAAAIQEAILHSEVARRAKGGKAP